MNLSKPARASSAGSAVRNVTRILPGSRLGRSAKGVAAIALPTRGIAVDYDFDGPGIDFTDGRAFYAIAPTIFDQADAQPVSPWNIVDPSDGTFSGVVRATAELTTVELYIEADSLVPISRLPPRISPFAPNRRY